MVGPGHRSGGESIWDVRAAALLAFDAISGPKAYRRGKRWIEAGFSPDSTAVADPDIDLKTLS